MEVQTKIYDLEERTFVFAKNTRVFVKKAYKSIWNVEDIKQLVRFSGSVAANYIEVNENLGDKDLLMKLRICKKEAKETILWLRLLDIEDVELNKEKNSLISEATELKNIFGAIYQKRINN